MSLYRKYRSQNFNDIIGQEHIVKTLRGAISSEQIGHAYIFSGMRGTGKTSIARIFAKAVNCFDLKENSEPCGQCNVCKESTEGSFLDLIEIDAASNRGIDDIRDLREKIKFAPNIGKYKVYIIDEVHMLTPDAFNALLKTLEEPPAHAIFILATTEIHKVPSTILSRCQRFNFHKIESIKMFDGIKKIAEKEKIKIEDRSLQKIVSLSEGSLRDALSHLDQISSFAHGEEIGFTLLEDILGVANEERLLTFLEIILEKNISKIISFINDLTEQGKDLENFVKESIRFVRKIMFLKINNGDSADISDIEKAKTISNSFSLDELIKLIETLNSILKNTKFSFIPQLYLEIELIKLFNSDNHNNESLLKKPGTKESTKEEVILRKEDIKITKEENTIEEKKEEPSEPQIQQSVKTGGAQEFLAELKKEKMMLYTFAQNCDFKENDASIDIAVVSHFCFNSLTEKNNYLILEKIAKNVFGEGKKINIIKAEENKENIPKRDLVSDALNVFGGELID